MRVQGRRAWQSASANLAIIVAQHECGLDHVSERGYLCVAEHRNLVARHRSPLPAAVHRRAFRCPPHASRGASSVGAWLCTWHQQGAVESEGGWRSAAKRRRCSCVYTSIPDTHTTALRGEVIELLGIRNFQEICLSDSRFAYEKFAYVLKQILSWAKPRPSYPRSYTICVQYI